MVHSWALSVPVDPSADEAREWLQRELSRPEYADDRSLLQRFVDWVAELVSAILMRGSGGLPGWVLPVALALVATLLGVLLVAKVGRDPGARGGRGGSVIDEPHLDAEAYRTRARAAWAAGDLDTAAADWFRAITAAAAERGLIDDSPGRTAHEVSLALAALVPDEAAAVSRAADHFDAVRYGDAHVDRATARFVADLDERLTASRPFLKRTGVGS